MIKKSMALLMVLCMTIALIQLPASADYTNQWTESFEIGSGAVAYNNGQEYISNGDNGLLLSPYKEMGMANWASHLTIEPTTGYDGTGGIYLHCDTSKNGNNYRGAYLMTRGVVLGENETAVLRYKVKFLEMESMSGLSEYMFLSGISTKHSTGNSWQIGVYESSKAALRALNTEFGTTSGYQLEKWYTFVTAVTGTGATKSTKTYILNEDNTLKSSTTPKSIDLSKNIPADSSAETEPIYFWPVVVSGASATKKRLVVDDVSLTVVNTAGTQAISFDPTGSSVKNGDTGVSVSDGIRLAFDHDLASTAADTVKLYKKADTEKTSPIACTVSGKAFDSFLLKPNVALDEETEYVLDFSSVTGSAGQTIAQASKEISFTTEEAATDVVSSTPVSGATNVSSELKQMTVTFNKTIAVAPETVTLTSENDTVTANVSTTDNHIFTFDWTDELDGMATYTVNVEAFKDGKGLSPVTKTISFTVGNADMQILADDFEDASMINASGTGYTSSLFTTYSSSVASDVTEVQQVDGFTPGTKALQFSTGTAASAQYLNPLWSKTEHAYSDEEKMVATWRFRLDQAATYDTANKKYGPQICLGTSYSANYTPGTSMASTVIQMQDGKIVLRTPAESVANAREIYEDRWYNIIYVMGKTTESIYVVDALTGEFVYKRNANYWGAALDKTNYTNYIIPVSAPKTKQADASTAVYNENQIYTIDDFKLWKIKPGRSTHKLTSSGSITQEDGTVTINFNQPVLPDDDMFSLYYGDGERAYKRPEIRQPDFCKVEIDYTGLDKLTDYELDYSGAKAISGAEIANKTTAVYEFTSDPAQSDVSVVGDVRCTGLTSGSTITANVYSNEARTVDIVAAFYEKTYPAKLQTVVLTGGVELDEGENTVTINLNRNINANIVKIFAWENGTLVPLMEEYKTLTPVDTLDILFIGSSLSEDSGRLFDQILAAAGHNTTNNRDINVTVKFVGGGSFVYHYNNLKREIDSNLDEAILSGDTDTLQDYVDTQDGIMAGKIASSDTDKTRRLYTTFENGVTQTDGPEDRIMLSALLDKQYDFISLQPSAHAYDYNSMVNGTEEEDFVTYERELSYLTSTIREYQPNAEIVLFQTWTHYYGSAPYGDQARRHKYFTNLIKPYVDKWAVATGENVENITDGGEAMTISPVGYAFYLADEFLPWAGNMYCLDSGNNTADAKAWEELRNKFNTSQGLLRDADHASYYGTFLADAVWYEMFTGNRASAGTVAAPAIARPSGVGPLFQNGAIVEGQTKQYFTITAEEHHARLEQLADIAHQAVKEYNTLKRMK